MDRQCAVVGSVIMTPAELTRRREKLGLTLPQLATALGVAYMTMWRWEAGKATIGNPQMLDLALQALEHNQHSTK
jgi:transcriptional regulator with XRE-family HTH domain